MFYTYKLIKNNFYTFLFSSLEGAEGASEVIEPIIPSTEKTIDFSGLSPENRAKAEEIMKQIEELKKGLGELDASEEIVGRAKDILRQNFIKQDVKQSDPDAKLTIDLYNTYIGRLESIVKEKKDVQTQLTKLKTSLDQEINGVSQIGETVDNLGYTEIFGKDNESINTGKTEITLNLSDQVKKDFPSLAENFTLSDLPYEIGEITVNDKKYTRIQNTIGGEFVDEEGNFLVAENGMNIKIGDVRKKEDLDKQINSINESNEGKNTVDSIISEVIKYRGLDAGLLSGVIREKLEAEVNQDYDENTTDSLNQLILKKYNPESLKQRVEEIAKKEAFKKGAYETDIKTLNRLSKAKSDEEKMSIMQDKIDYAQTKYPSTWVEKITPKESTWDTSNMSTIEKFFIKILSFLTGKDLFGNIGGADFLPEKAGDMIGGSGSAELGSLSEHFESGGKGPNAINSNDNGKPSFGTYQLRDEKLKEFIDSNPSLSGYPEGYNQVFDKGGTSEFSTWWKNKVNEIGKEKFKQMEHAFIKEQFYDKQVNKISSLGQDININDFPVIIQNVVWSTAVQHGQNTDILVEAIKKNGGLEKGNKESLIGFVESVYAIRLDRYGAGAKRYGSEKTVALQNLKMGTQGIGVEGIAGVQSLPVERSSSGTTLCSRTARLNASRFGLNVPGGSSAKAAYENSGSPKGDFPPKNSNARFADVFLDASKKNAQYGHRAFAFQEKGQWYILDPYYAMPGINDRQSAIPAETYVSQMGGTLGRRFWGAKFFG